jgi:hypothetical protein
MPRGIVMDDQKALSIVSALANGVNPLSGEVFPVDSPYQASEVVRALFAATRALERVGQLSQGASAAPGAAAPRERTRPAMPGNVGKPWSPEEDQRLLAEFQEGRKPAELARLLGRTLAGVEARLEKHGRLTPQQRQTTNRYTKPGAQATTNPQSG